MNQSGKHVILNEVKNLGAFLQSPLAARRDVAVLRHEILRLAPQNDGLRDAVGARFELLPSGTAAPGLD